MTRPTIQEIEQTGGPFPFSGGALVIRRAADEYVDVIYGLTTIPSTVSRQAHLVGIHREGGLPVSPVTDLIDFWRSSGSSSPGCTLQWDAKLFGPPNSPNVRLLAILLGASVTDVLRQKWSTTSVTGGYVTAVHVSDEEFANLTDRWRVIDEALRARAASPEWIRSRHDPLLDGPKPVVARLLLDQFRIAADSLVNVLT